METRADAEAALESIARTRAAIGWAGYPTWYWLVLAGALALLPMSTMLPSPQDVAASAILAAAAVAVAAASTKARGVHENTRGSLPTRDGLLVVTPPLAAILAGAFLAQVWWWSPFVIGAATFTWVTTTALVLQHRRTTAR